MPNANEIHGTVFKNASATFLARVVNSEETPITDADIASAKYSVYLVDENDMTAHTVVSAHSDVSVSVGSIIFGSLQNDDSWDVDNTGYNFKHSLDVLSDQAFTEAGRIYRIVFELTPTYGQVIVVRFRVHVI